MVLVVTLDLHGPAAAYDKLYDTLKKQGTWWHYMRWTWLLDTSHSPSEVIDALQAHIQSEDRVLVVPLTRPYQGLLKPDEWKWITSRMSPKKASGAL